MKTNVELQAEVKEAVNEALQWRYADVAVNADGGIVVLRGEVLTFDERQDAERAASRVDGVSAVINELMATEDPITLSLDGKLANEAAASLSALGGWAASLAVSVVDRAATITGIVDDEAQYQEARKAVEAVPGVRAVVNLIRVAGTPIPGAVERRIASEFEGEGMPGPERVRVDVRHHVARLTGRLDSVAERDVAVAAAQETPGIIDVQDELEIG